MATLHRIAIVEDDTETRRLLVGMVRSTPPLQLVGEYGATDVAVARLPADQPDVVLMDINLPGMNGIECVRQLKLVLPSTQFLMLTVYEDQNHIFAALAAGATGYLLKNTKRTQLLEAITQISNGGSPMSSAIARKVVQSFARPPAAPSPVVESLSPREQAVLELIAKGFLCKEIADQLGVTGHTVNTYIRRIYEKLQVRSRSQAVALYLKQST